MKGTARFEALELGAILFYCYLEFYIIVKRKKPSSELDTIKFASLINLFSKFLLSLYHISNKRMVKELKILQNRGT